MTEIFFVPFRRNDRVQYLRKEYFRFVRHSLKYFIYSHSIIGRYVTNAAEEAITLV